MGARATPVGVGCQKVCCISTVCYRVYILTPYTPAHGRASHVWGHCVLSQCAVWLCVCVCVYVCVYINMCAWCKMCRYTSGEKYLCPLCAVIMCHVCACVCAHVCMCVHAWRATRGHTSGDDTCVHCVLS